MSKSRRDAFSDGVIAILITIMIMVRQLKLKLPAGPDTGGRVLHSLATANSLLSSICSR